MQPENCAVTPILLGDSMKKNRNPAIYARTVILRVLLHMPARFHHVRALAFYARVFGAGAVAGVAVTASAATVRRCGRSRCGGAAAGGAAPEAAENAPRFVARERGEREGKRKRERERERERERKRERNRERERGRGSGSGSGSERRGHSPDPLARGAKRGQARSLQRKAPHGGEGGLVPPRRGASGRGFESNHLPDAATPD